MLLKFLLPSVTRKVRILSIYRHWVFMIVKHLSRPNFFSFPFGYTCLFYFFNIYRLHILASRNILG